MPIISSITHAENSKRKNHRITIPIQIILNQKIYIVTDWSMNGLKVEIPSNQNSAFKIGDTIKAQFILPTGESSIILDAEVIIKNIKDSDYGMQISAINEKNRRVLRHYATLAIDGNIDHVDNLSSSLFMLNVASPIKEPISMSDKESTKIHKSFLKRFFLYLIFSLLFLVIATLTILYNYIIVKDTVGLTAGNSLIYFAPYDGKIKDVYINKGDKIAKNQALFEMQDKEYKSQLKILEDTRVLLHHQKEKLLQDLNQYEHLAKVELSSMKNSSRIEAQTIKNKYATEKETYTRAKYLYENQLLSFSDFSSIENRYLTYKDEYESTVNQTNPNNKKTLLLKQNYAKIQDQIISTKNSFLFLSKEIESNKFNISKLKHYSDNSLIISSEPGRVYNVNRKTNEMVKYADNVLIVETNAKPFILVKVLSQEIAKIQIGALCVIASDRTGKSYNAHITGIGYPAIDGVYVKGNELSQNEVPIKIEFDDESVRFNLNEYVNVYITNSSFLAQKIIKLTREQLR